ncbi:hypothetical protein B0T25DRAFT_162866 [Lasiosphaeria hispida]|uniref:Uncharacterized protein n=1 Tax=Lasiosphaeria hispida TaxID=260671 RepID=A0AAJ0HMP2_9PEZI|nr:hypothetical protein B0T25DRAFT_162866 [Lasiosphaeria hispida]
MPMLSPRLFIFASLGRLLSTLCAYVDIDTDTTLGVERDGTVSVDRLTWLATIAMLVSPLSSGQTIHVRVISVDNLLAPWGPGQQPGRYRSELLLFSNTRQVHFQGLTPCYSQNRQFVLSKSHEDWSPWVGGLRPGQPSVIRAECIRPACVCYSQLRNAATLDLQSDIIAPCHHTPCYYQRGGVHWMGNISNAIHICCISEKHRSPT